MLCLSGFELYSRWVPLIIIITIIIKIKKNKKSKKKKKKKKKIIIIIACEQALHMLLACVAGAKATCSIGWISILNCHVRGACERRRESKGDFLTARFSGHSNWRALIAGPLSLPIFLSPPTLPLNQS